MSCRMAQNSGRGKLWQIRQNKFHSPIFYPDFQTSYMLSYCKLAKVSLAKILKRLIHQSFTLHNFTLCSIYYLLSILHLQCFTLCDNSICIYTYVLIYWHLTLHHLCCINSCLELFRHSFKKYKLGTLLPSCL